MTRSTMLWLLILSLTAILVIGWSMSGQKEIKEVERGEIKVSLPSSTTTSTTTSTIRTPSYGRGYIPPPKEEIIHPLKANKEGLILTAGGILSGLKLTNVGENDVQIRNAWVENKGKIMCKLRSEEGVEISRSSPLLIKKKQTVKIKGSNCAPENIIPGDGYSMIIKIIYRKVGAMDKGGKRLTTAMDIPIQGIYK